MRKQYVILFTLIVLLSTAMSVQAMESKTMERHNGASAFASWDGENAAGYCYTSLTVIEADEGTEIYVFRHNYSQGRYKEGYLFTNENVFKVDPKLKSASLSEVQIEVSDPYTGEKETFTVQADWTGEGDVSTGSSSYTSKDGDYKFKSSESSSYRDAFPTGNINGYELGGDTCDAHGSLSKFKSASITMEK